ncbi:MAG: type II secretion system F family protein [Rhizobiaceae bacterium]
MIIILYSVIFVTALLLADLAVRHFIGLRQKNTEVNLRLQLINETGDQLEAHEALLRKRRLGKDKQFSFSNTWLSKVYTQSGVQASFGKKMLIVLASSVIIIFVLSFFVGNFFVLLVVSAVATVFSNIGLLLYLRAKRIRKYILQLSDAIDVIVRSLGAGHPLPSAIGLVSREMPDPVGTEFGLLSDELTYGSEVDDALINMSYRVGADEIKLLAVLLNVQRKTGGNLGEILDNLSGVIRARAMMKAKIKAISAEGRITAVIMAMFPFFLFFMIKALVPDYFDPLWETGYGDIVVSVCATFMIFGIIILYRLVRFDF